MRILTRTLEADIQEIHGWRWQSALYTVRLFGIPIYKSIRKIGTHTDSGKIELDRVYGKNTDIRINYKKMPFTITQ